MDLLLMVAGLLVVLVGTVGTLSGVGVEPFATWYYLFAWYGTLLAGDGLFARLKRTSGPAAREDFYLLGRPAHLLTLLGWSAVIWLFFELVNFRLQNWYYVFLPEERGLRWAGMLAAFATVLPAVFLSEALLERARVARHARWPPLRVTGRLLTSMRVAGAAMLIFVLVWPRYCFPLIWVAVTLIVEPSVYRRAPERSLLGDLGRGEPGRMLRLLLGGAAIGLLWEIINAAARARWIYTVPGLEDVRLFEMPVLGFLGFPPFALECFVLWQALVVAGIAIPREGHAFSAPMRRSVVAVAASVPFCVSVLIGMDSRTVSSLSPQLRDLTGVPADLGARTGLDVFSLAQSDSGQLAKLFGVDTSHAAEWVQTARLATLRGIGTYHASLLRRLGISSVDALARTDATQLVSRLETLTGTDFVDARVRVWVRGARDHVSGVGARVGVGAD